MKILTTIGAVLFAVAGIISTAAAAAKVGDQAPDFELQGSDGQMHHLADFKDKQAVVLAWFPKAFTGGCTAECKSMKEEGDAIRKYDVAYFMISVDPQEGEKGNKAFAEKYSADFPILSDPDKKVANDYGVLNAGKGDTAHRWTFYIDKSGKIAYIEKHVDTDQSRQRSRRQIERPRRRRKEVIDRRTPTKISHRACSARLHAHGRRGHVIEVAFPGPHSPISLSNSASLRIATPSLRSLSSLLPAFSPATK